ncbi:hypothetical protein AOL_s00043g825 [Orbilia oligospora ATCC 24927]|uniref:Uncharacterized protein n=1 Tax=Arthrobotrys oligospora (strain ATCC 24927 / CBS 115.81 / DSM 1491) TaxID=756982 RepID=G1X551_ARTOA|nr:hypothetical protein AOL_s00043g825 [Orbilia oligospora ATCC 24927]EGX51806.1 hypothetical protein AOL_s00043g825 [Orbilia oligospora ATCC 24927]
MEEVSSENPHFWGSMDNFYSDDTASSAHRNSVSSHIFSNSSSETVGNYAPSPRFQKALNPMVTDFAFGNFINNAFQESLPIYSPSSQISASSLQFSVLERTNSSSSLDQVVHNVSTENPHHQSVEESLWDQLQKGKTQSTYLCDWMNAVLEIDMDPSLHGYSKVIQSHNNAQYTDIESNRPEIMIENPDIYNQIHIALRPRGSITSTEPAIDQEDPDNKSLQEITSKERRGSGGSERRQIKRKTAPNKEDDGAGTFMTKKPRYISMRDIKETLGFSHSDGRSDNDNEESCSGDGAGWQRIYSNWRKDIASMAVVFVSLEAFTKSTRYKDSDIDGNGRRLNVIHGTFKWRGWNEMSESEQKGFLKSAFRLPWFGVTHSSAKIDEWIKNGFSSTENSDVNAIVDAAKTVILDVFKKRKDGMKSAYIEAYIDGIIEMDANGMISARLKRDEGGCRDGGKFDQRTKSHQTSRYYL